MISKPSIKEILKTLEYHLGIMARGADHAALMLAIKVIKEMDKEE